MTPLNESTSPLYTRAVDLLERIQDRFCKAKVSEDVSSDEDWLIKEVAEFKHFARKECLASADKAGVSPQQNHPLAVKVAVENYVYANFPKFGVERREMVMAKFIHELAAIITKTCFLSSPQPAPTDVPREEFLENEAHDAAMFGGFCPAPVGEGTPETDAESDRLWRGKFNMQEIIEAMEGKARSLERRLTAAEAALREAKNTEINYAGEWATLMADVHDYFKDERADRGHGRVRLVLTLLGQLRCERDEARSALTAAQSELGDVAASASEWMGIAQRRADELVDLRHQLEEARKERDVDLSSTESKAAAWDMVAALIPDSLGLNRSYAEVVCDKIKALMQSDSARTPRKEGEA